MRWRKEMYLSVVLILIGVAGVVGSLKVPLSERFTLGPGALPLIYSVFLLLFAIALLFMEFGKQKDEPLNGLPTVPGKYGLFFFLFSCAFPLSVYLIGFTLGLFLFSFLSLLFIGRWEVKKALLFSVIWAIALYILFQYIFSIPFIEGFLFETR